jgi:RNase P subunit RPR2
MVETRGTAMRHLICGRCHKRLIENFWVLVEEEPIPTFSRVTLTCVCGHVVSVSTGHGMRWLTPPDPRPAFASALSL